MKKTITIVVLIVSFVAIILGTALCAFGVANGAKTNRVFGQFGIEYKIKDEDGRHDSDWYDDEYYNGYSDNNINLF